MGPSKSPSPGFPLWDYAPTALPLTTIEYELRADELLEYYVWASSKSPALRRLRRRVTVRQLVGLLILFLALITIVLETAQVRGAAIYLYAYAEATGMCLLITLIGLTAGHGERAMRRTYATLVTHPSYRILLGPRRVQLLPDAYVETSARGESRIVWSAIQRIDVDPRFMFVDLGAAGSFIIPRRVFPDEQAYWEFVRLARETHEAARRQGQSNSEPS